MAFGLKIKGGCGHGINYYSSGEEIIFNEMLANYSSVVKLSDYNKVIRKMEQYLGKKLINMIAKTYYEIALQNKMNQTKENDKI